MLRGDATGKDDLKVSDDEFRALEAKYKQPKRHFALERGPNRMIFISQSGKVYQGTGTEQASIGNVFKDSVDKILETHARNYKKLMDAYEESHSH
jgi:hypothetical protein